MAAMRKDGQQTCNRLLEAATVVFAQKGYRDTTVAAIAKEAGCNTAAVNYHYGSKEQLYAAVWHAAFDKVQEAFPLEGGLTVENPAAERLRIFIQSMINRLLSLGELGCAGQILLMELGHPTEVIEMVRMDAVEPIRFWMDRIIRDLLGPGASQQQVIFCITSVVHQCLALGFRQGKTPPPFRDLDPQMLKEDLAEHIYQFSMAGIAAVRRQVEDRE
jgi:TetR/AcrR family transcriptional regulator, regulator of cefoperazone and chloramphenicol sensitivity